MSAITPPTSNQLWGLGALVSLVPLIFFRAFVLVCLWSWFITPLGVPAIGMALAMGINITATFLTHRAKSRILGEEPIFDNAHAVKQAWAHPIIFLVFGFVFSFFV